MKKIPREIYQNKKITIFVVKMEENIIDINISMMERFNKTESYEIITF